MFKDFENIVSDLSASYYNTEHQDVIAETLSEKLREVDDTASNYLCENCRTSINNEVFHYQNGKCPHCGNKVEVLQENQVLMTEKRYTCPNCKTTLPFNKLEESRRCDVCRTVMDVYTPYVPPKKKEI